MANINIYVPDKIKKEVVGKKLPLSRIFQEALRDYLIKEKGEIKQIIAEVINTWKCTCPYCCGEWVITGRETPVTTRFCPYCGKVMEVRTEEEKT